MRNGNGRVRDNPFLRPTRRTAPEPLLLTGEQVADLLQVRPSTVADLRRRGDLPAVRVGRSYRYTRADLEAFIRASRTVSGR